MRKLLFAFAVVGAAAAWGGARAAPAATAPVVTAVSPAQTVQYYAPEWRERQEWHERQEWRRRREEEGRRHEAWRREHEWRERRDYARPALPYYGPYYAPRY